jgi:hypothetical protein
MPLICGLNSYSAGIPKKENGPQMNGMNADILGENPQDTGLGMSLFATTFTAV